MLVCCKREFVKGKRFIFFNGKNDFRSAGGGKKRLFGLPAQMQFAHPDIHVGVHFKINVYGGQLRRLYRKTQFLPVFDGKCCQMNGAVRSRRNIRKLRFDQRRC